MIDDGGEKITHVKLVEEIIDGGSIAREVFGCHDQESERERQSNAKVRMKSKRPAHAHRTELYAGNARDGLYQSVF